MTSGLGVLLVKGKSEVLPLPFRLLDELDYQEYVTARTELFKFAKRQELFRLVYTNYMEYKNTLNKYFRIHCEKCEIDGSYLEGMIFDINRLVLNFLSAVRTFLDHAQTYITKTYGEKSEELQSFNKSRFSCFDTHFSFRFLSKLRNYSQHIGMPITDLHASYEVVNLDPLEYDYVLKPITLKDDLLKFDDFKWGKYTELDELGNPKLDELGNPKKLEIKNEIYLLPEKIDIDSYIDEMMDCIKLIDRTLCGKNEFIKLLQYKTFLDKLVKEANEFSTLLQNPAFLEELAKGASEFIKSSDTLEKLVKEADGIIPGVFMEIQDFSTGKLSIDRIPLNIMKLIDSLNIYFQDDLSEQSSFY